MRRPPIVVGMNPGGPWKRKNSTHDRLGAWMDALGVPVYSFTNVHWEPGKLVVSEESKRLLSASCEGYEKVIALGAEVSMVLTRLGIQHHRMPHPSPRNRLLNDPEFVVDELVKAGIYMEV